MVLTSVAHHFIGKDPIDAILIERDHPVESPHLVVPHGAILDVCGEAGPVTLATSKAVTAMDLHCGTAKFFFSGSKCSFFH